MQLHSKTNARALGIDDQSRGVQFERFGDVQREGFTLDANPRIIRHFQLFDEVSPGL